MQLIILNIIRKYSNSRGMCNLRTKVCKGEQLENLKMSYSINNNSTNVNNSQTEHLPANNSGSHNSFSYCNFEYNNFNRGHNRCERRTEESINNVRVHHLAQPFFDFYINCPIYCYPPWQMFHSFVSFVPPLPYRMSYQNNLSYLHPYVLHSLPSNSNRRYFHRRPEVVADRNRRHDQGRFIMSLRLWEKISSKNSTPKPGFIFTLMSYNVLAQDLLEQHPYLYQNHNRSALKWKTRWSNLLSEIKTINPDILCLQEVQESHIKDYYSTLEALGYKGIYKKKTHVLIDGCAIYYKVDNITLVEQITVEYFQKNVPLLDRDNVGIIAKFAPKLHPTREFVVATTHLLFSPKRDDIRLAQVQILLSEIDRISYKKQIDESELYLPVVLTGDLNSLPNADIYKFLTNGKLKYDRLAPKLANGTRRRLVTSNIGITDTCQHVDLIEKRKGNTILTRFDELKLIDIDNSDCKVDRQSIEISHQPHLFSTGTLSHKFAFRSVYMEENLQIREATTFQSEWVVVDYIFYSTKNNSSGDKLKLLSRCRLPTLDELNSVRIPNHSLGSDHFSLTAKFKLEF